MQPVTPEPQGIDLGGDHDIDLRTAATRAPAEEVPVFTVDDGAAIDHCGAVAVLGHKALSTVGAVGVVIDQARSCAAASGDTDLVAACTTVEHLLDDAARLIRDALVLQHGWTAA